jgi:hypothetical protein
MRSPWATAAAIGLLGLGAPVAATAAAGSSVSQRQIASAVRRAERSTSLWATINVCNSRADPHAVGVRGQMPSLGLRSRMSITVQLTSYSTATKRFIPIDTRYTRANIALGAHASGLQQAGVIFPFPKTAIGDWAAAVTFTWKRAGKLLGKTARATTAGHRDADYGSPPHYTAAACRM